MEKILDIIELIAYEKDLQVSVVSQVVKDAIIKMAKKEIDENIDYTVEEDPKERTFKLIHTIRVCEENDPKIEEDSTNFISISKAKTMDPDLKAGDEIKYELSLEDMSRNAVNLLFKDLEFNIQRTIENQLFEKFKSIVGKIITGVVIRVDESQNTYIEIDEIRAVLPVKNRIKGEKFVVGDTVSSILKHVGINKNGICLELSRTTPKMLEELLALEVPEIKDGEVVIAKSARIPGDRAKIALYSNNPKIDPIGASVGVKGVRINAVSKELNGENIDCIEYSEVPEIFISKALAPANIISIKIQPSEDENTPPKAIINIMSDQKSKAIGKNGINIRLASMLTGYDIELIEMASEKDSQDAQDKTLSKVGIDALESLFKQ
ncbi:transcription termination/antitermination protein NusA [Helicobacter sp. 12S02232-10]|uniref:transcription termination factor NusA n=1 Tax=Helicobacter sp. 12S02232-10 TaxID=1476197 RepID=UPI000BA59C0B|nr:transcription termination factor NusA [Helicobacter sp. 12S02232-10]PAF46881.1 transcription termination/antitermination protein NusA [Helicobacter sp. 12S02232-10]